MSPDYQLPDGWASVKLGEIAPRVQYGYTESATMNKVGPKFLRITDIQNNVVNWDAVPYCAIDEAKKQLFLLNEGDLVIARTGATVGKSFLISGNIPEAVFASYLIRITLYEDLEKKFIWHYLQSNLYWKQIQREKIGTGQPNVNAQKLSKLIVPLPPLLEQRRIVDKLEELFTKLDAGVEALKKTKTQLKRYKQAVLQEAVSGKLIPQDPNDELASELLRKIKTEKEKLIKEKKISKEKELPPISKEEIPFGLPNGWVWIRLVDLLALEKNAMKRGPFGGSLRKEIFVKDGYLVYEQRHAIHNDFNYQKYFITPQKFEEMKMFKVIPGDLIISCSGTLGRISEIPSGAREGIINQALLKIKLNNKIIRNDFFIYLFNSITFQARIFEKAKGSAITNMVGVDELKQIVIGLPPLHEQERIVEEISYRLSIAENVQNIANQCLKQSATLRQSILRRAFDGRLVSQYLANEPTKVLREEIKGGRSD